MATNDNIFFEVKGLNPKTSIISIGSTSKQMNKDVYDTSNTGFWTHARNAINNSPSGDYLILGNEPGNKFVVSAPYTIIGTIYLFDNIWVIFSTAKTSPYDTTYNNNNQNIGCEIGLFNLNNINNPTAQTYISIVDDYQLNFCQTHPISGTSRVNHNGEWYIYWDDGLNPTRYLNLGNPERWTWNYRNPKLDAWCDSVYVTIPYIMQGQSCNPPIPIQPLTLDIEKTMLIPNIKPIRVYGKQDKNSGGTLPNGLYFVATAYVLSGNRISDYFISEPIHIHTDTGTNGAIDITIADIEDENIQQYELVIVSFVNEQLTAKKMGIYNTSQRHHNFDTIHPTLENVPLSDIVLLTNKFQKSNITTSVNSYLIRIAPHNKFEINYQPIANLIIPKYIVCEAPEEYYEDCGNAVGYMRDEVYSFFIRWIYKDGERTPSYIIPGPPDSTTLTYDTGYPTINAPNVFSGYLTNDPQLKVLGGGIPKPFISTEAYEHNVYRYNLDDYINNVVAQNNSSWQSTQEYSDFNVAMHNYISAYGGGYTNSNIPTPVFAKLCGENIRLIRFPSESDNPVCSLPGNPLSLYRNGKIRILGIKFENILRPIDNNGRYIKDIIGYEILRSDRNGNKTIIAKGIINSYGEYYKYNGIYSNGLYVGRDNYLYQNYPLNDIRPNDLLTLHETRSLGNTAIHSVVLGNISQVISNIAREPSMSISGYQSALTCPDYIVISGLYNTTFLIGQLLSAQSFNFSGGACSSSVQHNKFSNKYFSFHSPDTTFKRPFLNISKIKTYSYYKGKARTIYVLPHKHPKQKLLKKSTEFFALLLSIGIATIKLNGKRTIKASQLVLDGNAIAIHSGADAFSLAARVSSRVIALISILLMEGILSQLENSNNILALNTVGTTERGIIDTFNNIRDVVGATASVAGGATYITPEISAEATEYNSLPKILRQGLFLPYFLTNLSTTMSSLRQLYIEMSAFRDYVLHTVTHCYYDDINPNCRQNNTIDIDKAAYIFNHNTIVSDSTYSSINVMNKDRNRHVFLALKSVLSYSFNDNSRFRILDLYQPTCDSNHLSNVIFNASSLAQWILFCNNPTNKVIETKSETIYVGLHVDNDNVYGRLYNNKQLIVGIPQYIGNYGNNIFISDVQFGGDTYIGRYAEKNAFFYFNDYPHNMPDGTEYNYLLQRTVLYPRYWLSTQINIIESILESAPSAMCNQTGFISQLLGTTTNLQSQYVSGDPPNTFLGTINFLGRVKNNLKGIGNAISNLISALQPPGPIDGSLWNTILANVMSYNLDGNVFQWLDSPANCTMSNMIGTMKGVWFYLSHIGIREFWVESEVNLAFRMMGDSKSERFYHHKKNSSLPSFVDEEIIRLEDYYKYDWSMSVSKLYSALASFGVLQRQDYDCITADILSGPALNMLIYSLPQDNQNHKDNWHIFLPLNYKIFEDNITTIKQINDSGALILFRNSAPLFFIGIDTLQSQSNINISIGTGGLFAQPLRSATNADKMYEYGSMQNRMAIINTPYGIFYLGIDQDKIFSYSGGLQEISNSGMRWWLTKYCQFNIIQQFPDYDMLDNTIIGVGALASFDNQNGMVYFHKIDYKLKDEWYYNREYRFDYKPGTGLFEVYHLDAQMQQYVLVDVVNVHNTKYFKDVSWTLSYDPKIKAFISFHDWHPSLTCGSQDTFFSIVEKSIYLHNADCQSYCVYYGVQYPFEIEFETSDSMTISTIRNIEYILEVYKYEPNCIDRFHVLDENFNEAIVYNSEQCTGLMRMFPKPKNNPLAQLQYPQYNVNSVDILYSKEENKYRINNLLDIVSDRGEFSGNEITIWNTEENGYVKNLNPSAIDYNKPVVERKKLRHYKNRVFLRKNFSRSNNMYKFLFVVAFIKKLHSAR